jgi:FkbM family methyltransferase
VELQDTMKKENREIHDSPAVEKVYKLPNDMIIHHLNASETNFLYSEIFENNTYLKYGISLQEGAVVFDVGANIGMFTLFIKSIVKKSKVYAFEPIPPICDILRINSSQFGSEVAVYESGLADTEKMAVLTYYPGYSILSGAYTNFEQDSHILLSGVERQSKTKCKKKREMNDRVKELFLEQTLSRKIEYNCKLTTVSNILRQEGVPRVDLLKIDVEKSEIDIMNGIDPEDWPKIRQIVVETHAVDGSVSKKIDSLLKENGFTTIIEHDKKFSNEYTPNIYAIKE